MKCDFEITYFTIGGRNENDKSVQVGIPCSGINEFSYKERPAMISGFFVGK